MDKRWIVFVNYSEVQFDNWIVKLVDFYIKGAFVIFKWFSSVFNSEW